MWPRARQNVFNARQKAARDREWSCVADILAARVPGRFLDVGTGSGYAVLKADQMGFAAIGIDPEIGTHGVPVPLRSGPRLIPAAAEHLPFEDEGFDVVFSSHALEHFADREAGLDEMKRVLKGSGTAVIVVPTATMAFVNVVSEFLFTTHIRLGRFLLRERSLRAFGHVFLPEAHGVHAYSAIQELRDFSIRHWNSLIGRCFRIQATFLPGLHPYADFPQFFPLIKSGRFSSSVVFVCGHHGDAGRSA